MNPDPDLGTPENSEIPEGAWTTFTRRTEDPKLSWLEDCLLGAGIPSRRNGASWHAPILQVRKQDLGAAWAFLTEADPNYGTVDDVPDDDPRYDDWVQEDT